MINALRRIAPYGLLLTVAALSSFGIAMLYSTTAAGFGERMLTRQFIWIVAGAGLAFGVNIVGYRRIAQYAPWALGAVALPLAYLAGAHVLDRLGVEASILRKLPLIGEGAVNGAWRWLRLGPASVQPSEFAKLGIVLFLAMYFGNNPRYIESFKRGLLIPIGAVGLVIGLVLAGGSLSITAITGAVVLGMLLVAGLRLRWFLLFACAGLAVLYAAMTFSPERVERMTTFRDPEATKSSSGYQLWHSQLAIGSGGMRGVGFNKSNMKQQYLPESHTDFIMAIMAEELGFVGTLTVVALYLLLMGMSFAVSITAPDRQGLLLAFGIGLMFGLQAFANLGVVSGFLPTTGVTAPLVSYGGSSIVASWLGIGLLLSIGRAAQTESDFVEEPPKEKGPQPMLVKMNG